ncbi:MAG: class I SAM-dependent RNA methyltransferase [Myxococcales bacterium]
MKVALRIESIVHGGEGLAHHEGRVVFVRGVAPGDVVEAEVTGKGRFEHARALAVIEAGKARAFAPCPIVERCAGCPLQHVAYSDQLSAKEALLGDALERIGGFPRESYELRRIVPSPRELRYRRRARLHRGPKRTWGFAGELADGIVPVDDCPLFEQPLQRLFEAVRGFDLPGATDIGLDTSDTGRGAIEVRADQPSPALRKRLRALVDSGLAAGSVLGNEIAGDPVLVDSADSCGCRLRSRPDLFAQANRSMVPALRAAALEALGDAVSGRVLELFCGTGTLTLPLLARAAAVVGVESSSPALQLLRKSADEVPAFSGKLRLVAGDAAKVARDLRDFDAALLDPPRTGAAAAVRALAQARVPVIAYVSCDAPTLARDARLLAGAGYGLRWAKPLDLFPQTALFEAVARFELQSSCGARVPNGT